MIVRSARVAKMSLVMEDSEGASVVRMVWGEARGGMRLKTVGGVSARISASVQVL